MNRIVDHDKHAIRLELLNRWRVAHNRLAASAADGDQFSAVPMSTECGVPGLTAALVISTGARAILLPADRAAEPAVHDPPTDSALVLQVLELHRRDGTLGRYIAVFAKEDHWDDIFCEFATDLIAHARENPARAPVIIEERVTHWRSFFSATHQREQEKMAMEREIGLFGELCVVRLLVDLSDEFDPASHWTGPRGHQHDFSLEGGAIEVKSTASLDSVAVTINGDKQLDPPACGPLALTLVRLSEDGPQAEKTSHLVLSICDRLDDPVPFLDLLQSAGMNLSSLIAEGGVTNSRSFNVIDIKWCYVDARIPRIIASTFASGSTPAGVTNLTYSSSLHDADWWAPETTMERIAGLLTRAA
jgi:hypothetical protein